VDSIEIERRTPVWLALSEFYLDIELQPEDFTRIRMVFAQSGYSQHEIKQIDYNEVGPILFYNLLSVAGEWMGFDEKAVVDFVAKRANRRFKIRTIPPFSWIWHRYIDFFNKSYFQSIFSV
jgi:hypothetical protein